MGLCEGATLVDFSDVCVRHGWATLAPASLVVLLLLFSIPIPPQAKRVLSVVRSPFTNFLRLDEALALDAGESPAQVQDATEGPIPLWRTLLLSGLGLSETLGWLSVGAFSAVARPLSGWETTRPFLVALAWLYATVQPATSPTATPPIGLFVFYLFHGFGDTLVFFGDIYDWKVSGTPLPDSWILTAEVANLVVVITLLTAVFSMPLAVPNKRVDPNEIVSQTCALLQLLRFADCVMRSGQICVP